MKYLTSVLLFALSCNIMVAQGFQNEIIYDTEFHSGVKRCLEDNDQNIIIAGYTKDTAYHYIGFMMKVGPGFDTVLRIVENDTADILFSDMLITPENNYFVIGGIGHDTGFNRNLDKVAIFIFDEGLNIITEKMYQMPEEYNYPQLFLWQAENGNVYAAGKRGNGYSELILLKFDQNGNLLLSSYPNLINSSIHCISEKPNNPSSFYAYGHGMPYYSMARMEIDANLNYTVLPLEADGDYGSFNRDATAKWLNDSVFLFSSLVSTDTVLPYAYTDNILIKFSEGLEPSDEYLTVGMAQTVDYGFSYNIDWKTPEKMFVATYDAYPSSGQYRYFVALFNENLDVLGAKTISGGEDIDYSLHQICATSDGGIICSGTTRTSSSEEYDWDPFVHKITAEEIVQVSEKTTNPFDSDYFVYPNPGQGTLNILTARKEAIVQFYGQNGECVFTEIFDNTLKNTINTSKLPDGIYILRFVDEKGYSESIKWIKEQ
ncbi:MAG: hypothetical protein DRJ05_00465 [Bacteroidetes bacterium]|nr:MAG: hypothetical protein DRJ05_00465 [Bacteroidota bacterium]